MGVERVGGQRGINQIIALLVGALTGVERVEGTKGARGGNDRPPRPMH